MISYIILRKFKYKFVQFMGGGVFGRREGVGCDHIKGFKFYMEICVKKFFNIFPCEQVFDN